MSATAVLIPFKADRRKTRLSQVLRPDQRRHLAELMLLDTLGAFREAGLLRRCYVISSDGKARALALKAGAQTIQESRDGGVNAAIWTGMKALGGKSRDFMVIPSDLPTLSAGEVRHALALKRVFGCVLSPSRSFDGTNLLVFSAKASLALSYDSNSFWNHIRGAAVKGLSLAVYCGAGVMSDVDTPKDLRVLSLIKKGTPSVQFAKEALNKRPS